VIALDQEEYYPIIVARIQWEDEAKSKSSIVRYRLTDKERRAIAEGADVIVSQPHHGPLMPLGLQVAFPGEYPLEGME
jgi:hypothetical protein